MNEAIEHLGRGDKHEPYNDPREWFRTTNPPSFTIERKSFQKKIDKIVGKSVRGQSIIMLKWAWECSFELFGRTRQLFRFITLPIKGIEVDFAIPRWVIVERVEPEQFRDSWEAARYMIDPSTRVTDISTERRNPITDEITYTGDVVYEGDKLDRGRIPNEWFQNLWVIADHDGSCCQRADKMSRACWGYYRDPDKRDIKKIEKIHHAKLNDSSYNQNPFEPLSAETVEASQKSAFEYKVEMKEKQDAELDLRLMDHFKSHLHRLQTDDPGVLNHGKFHFLGESFKRAESGLIIPS